MSSFRPSERFEQLPVHAIKPRSRRSVFHVRPARFHERTLHQWDRHDPPSGQGGSVRSAKPWWTDHSPAAGRRKRPLVPVNALRLRQGHR